MKDRSERKGARPVWMTVLMWVFFPWGLFDLMLSSVARRYKTDITTKTAIIETVAFAFLLLVFAVPVILIAALAPGMPHDALVRMIVVAALLFLGLVAAFAAMCTLTARRMLAPLKKMAERIEEITVEDMSARLDPVDTQDELDELSRRINTMLDGLQEAFDRQSNFISDASHELRTPISVIRGYSDLLSRWGKTDENVLTEAIDAIRTESANMKSIVEQLLYLAKLGSFKLRNAKFDLSETVRDIAEGYRLTSTDKTIACHADSGIEICADRGLTVELIRVIADNAIKYTPAGGTVDIRAAATPTGAEVTVADNGIGISEQDLPHIFDRFYRCDKARGRAEGSTGLGLAIAKSIAEMMGGNITAKSVLGSGSVFVINIPSAPASGDEKPRGAKGGKSDG